MTPADCKLLQAALRCERACDFKAATFLENQSLRCQSFVLTNKSLSEKEQVFCSPSCVWKSLEFSCYFLAAASRQKTKSAYYHLKKNTKNERIRVQARVSFSAGWAVAMVFSQPTSAHSEHCCYCQTSIEAEEIVSHQFSGLWLLTPFLYNINYA